MQGRLTDDSTRHYGRRRPARTLMRGAAPAAATSIFPTIPPTWRVAHPGSVR